MSSYVIICRLILPYSTYTERIQTHPNPPTQTLFLSMYCALVAIIDIANASVSIDCFPIKNAWGNSNGTCLKTPRGELRRSGESLGRLSRDCVQNCEGKPLDPRSGGLRLETGHPLRRRGRILAPLQNR